MRALSTCLLPRQLTKSLATSHRHLRIDDEYYITRSFLPAIGRIFNLVGANVEDWYKKMPRKVRVDRGNQPAESSQTVEEAQKAQPKIAIDQHFKSNACVACGDRIVSEPGIKPSSALQQSFDSSGG